MTIQKTNTRGRIGILGRTKALAAGLLVAAMMAAGLASAGGADASTTFTVNLPGDTRDADLGDGSCDVNLFGSGQQCTLRAAIEQANATAGADAIRFDIPDDFGAGVKTINVGATGNGALPEITQPVTIDGYTQPGASPNTKAVGDDAVLKVALDGSDLGAFSGLVIDNSSGSVIKGLAINGFAEEGSLQIQPAGIAIRGESVGNRIQGNFIGTDASGTLDLGNNQGVAITRDFSTATGALPSQNVVGGTAPAARNIISGNEMANVFVSGAGNQIKSNHIGTDKGGTQDLGTDGDGIMTDLATGTTVGGTTAAARNVISGNDGNGINVFSGQGTRVMGNRIGTTASGTGALGNGFSGVSVSGENTPVGDGTAGGSNTIAFNGRDGVAISFNGGNKVSRNSVFSNDGLGIDLVKADLAEGTESATTDIVNTNDAGDADTGPNNLQNRPSVGSARNAAGKTTIKGTLSSTPSKNYTVQFFSNPSGTNEGRVFIGQKSVATDGTGKATFTFVPASKVAAGRTITATATRITTGDTSEFSAPRTVASV